MKTIISIETKDEKIADEIITDIQTKYAKQLEKGDLKADISKTSSLLVYFEGYKYPDDYNNDDENENEDDEHTKSCYDFGGCGRDS